MRLDELKARLSLLDPNLRVLVDNDKKVVDLYLQATLDGRAFSLVFVTEPKT